jgi:hypothetical protein
LKHSRLCIAFLLSGAALYSQPKRFTISGYVYEKGSKESLINLPVYVPEIKNGTVTNDFGFYSITLPEMDSITVIFSYIGYQPQAKRFKLDRDIHLTVYLEGRTSTLKEAVISAYRSERVSESGQMSVVDIPIEQIKDIPALLGEKDVLKVLQLLPGVQRGSEGSAGFYVRGGASDQNQILLDDAPVYNAYHLFGFFSLFNGDAIKSVELYKGGFPARYGGRLSSVLDLRMKEGNKEKIHGEFGIGIVSSRFTLEGPLYKNKSSFLIAARRTYIDALAAPIIAATNNGETGGYYFYDLNAKLNYDFGDYNKVYISGYFGKDLFYLNMPSSQGNPSQAIDIGWGNTTATVRWNHLFSNKLFSNTSLIVSNYTFLISDVEKAAGNTLYSFNYTSGIRDYGLKYDLDFHPTVKHSIRAGFMTTDHQYNLETLNITDNTGNSGVNENVLNGIESAVYLEDDYKVSTLFKINAGARLTNFNTQDKNYFNAEPRISASYKLRENVALKACFTDMDQYINLLSPTGIGLPTDLWVPSTKTFPPQNSKQIAAGLAWDIIKYGLGITLEGYYKTMTNILGYKNGASFLNIGSNTGGGDYNWENYVTQGQGWSYGLEFMAQRKFGKLSGWVAYTLSWTQLQFDSLNYGNKFYAGYDCRNSISVVGIYKLREESKEKQGITLSSTFVYGTGNAITLPIASYNAPVQSAPGGVGGSTNFLGTQGAVTEYSAINAYRMAPYNRLDIGIQWIKTKKHGVRTWEFSIYNVYNRENPYFYYIGANANGNTALMQVSLFPIIPSVSYSFKF